MTEREKAKYLDETTDEGNKRLVSQPAQASSPFVSLGGQRRRREYCFGDIANMVNADLISDLCTDGITLAIRGSTDAWTT